MYWPTPVSARCAIAAQTAMVEYMPIVDVMTGMYSTIAVCAAIAHRAETGVGQYIDMALLDTQVAILANHLIDGDPEAADTSSKITMIQADVVILKFDPYAPSYKFPNGLDQILRNLGFVSMGRGGAKRIIKH